ncbi:MAG: FHA domain-containing protein [Gemmataceae bacterium]|nr:FHA domain-containing protein [Gemmataceae bacterium]
MSDQASAMTAEPLPASPEAAAPAGEPLPAGASPKLVCVRGLKLGIEYPVYEGPNFIGRSDEAPVDIDLDDQEKPESIWSSRQHACIHFENGQLCVEDLKSANGTYLNRIKVNPDTKVPVKVGDIIQIGAVHLKVQA